MFSYDINDLVKKEVKKLAAELAPKLAAELAPGLAAELAPGLAAELAAELVKQSKQQGELLGKVQILLKMMQRRFGTLPDWANEKIALADSSTLDRWGLNMMDAQSLDTVFSAQS